MRVSVINISTIRGHWAAAHMSDMRGGLKSDDGKDRKDRTREKVTTKYADLKETHPRASLSLLSWQPREPSTALKKTKVVKGGVKQVLEMQGGNRSQFKILKTKCHSGLASTH